MPEVVCKARHLRVIAVAHEEGSRAGQRHHHGNRGNSGYVTQRANDIGKPPHRDAHGRLGRIAKLGPIGCPAHPQEHRKVESRVEQDAPGRTEGQHDQPPDRWPHQNAKVPRGRHHAHRARQLGHLDDVVQQQLARGLPEHAGAAVQYQQDHGLPHLQRIGDKQVAPAQRNHGEHGHAQLDQAARIHALGQGAHRHREEQERQPVRHHGKTAQRGGVELLKHHPVADHVFDVVRHHRQRVGADMRAKVRIAPGGEGGWSGGGWVIHARGT